MGAPEINFSPGSAASSAPVNMANVDVPGVNNMLASIHRENMHILSAVLRRFEILSTNEGYLANIASS
ncbi:MAG: hypothetical protein FWF79_02170 [Defluviitaleaceae bacterium]|nr:hypothetical protein [Defluviitaleaceae bacterium]